MIGGEHSIAIADHLAVGAAIRAVYCDTYHRQGPSASVKRDSPNGAKPRIRRLVSAG
jgi:hypothetical protein